MAADAQHGDEPLHIEGFHIIRFLGKGGMGKVYLAREKDEGHLVALKVLARRLLNDEAAFEQFVREAILTSRLRHPNIVQVYELGEDRGRYYISMEYVSGPTLHQRLKAGPMDMGEATDILCQTLDAIETAHRQGVVHCDLKPGNILLAQGVLPKVSDLGIAHTWGPIHGDSPLPATWRATPAYVAPEQCVRGGAIDHRADIYSLGATFYHMLCGAPPFTAQTAEEYVQHHVRTPPCDPCVRNPSLSPALGRIVLRMLAKDPKDRFQRCAEVVVALEECGCRRPAGGGGPAVPHHPGSRDEEATSVLPLAE